MESTPFAASRSSCMSFFLPSITSYFGRKPLSTSTARSFLGRSLMCPSDAFTTNCLPRYLLMVFAFAGDSTITNAFAIFSFGMIADYPVTLPHFNKILARQLLNKPEHLQFEERRDELRRRDIFNLFKQIV